MDQKGKIVIISGFSGVGKGTLMKELMRQHRDKYALSVSATTRQPREGEQEGIDYFFVTRDKFESMIEKEELLEYAQYVGNYYGTPRAYVDAQLNAGRNVILEIEIQGALKVKGKFPETILMFVTAPSPECLKERLIGRGTEGASVIDARMCRACEESDGIENYDYIVVNDTINEGVALIDRLIENERAGKASENQCHRVSANIDYINHMRAELKCFAKGE